MMRRSSDQAKYILSISNRREQRCLRKSVVVFRGLVSRQPAGVVQVLDPLCLLQQLERLQQALWRHDGSAAPLAHDDMVPSLLRFCVQDCLEGFLVSEAKIPAPAWRGQLGAEMLDWPRTSKDPFEGKWELILSLVLAHPEWSGSDLFEELQRRFPII
jgi:hypothetical protein